MITIDDVIDVIDEEAEEDLMALAGVGEANVRSSLWETMQGRSWWLLVNLVTAIIASAVIGLFDATIERLVALAVLMPIVASMGGMREHRLSRWRCGHLPCARLTVMLHPALYSVNFWLQC